MNKIIAAALISVAAYAAPAAAVDVGTSGQCSSRTELSNRGRTVPQFAGLTCAQVRYQDALARHLSDLAMDYGRQSQIELQRNGETARWRQLVLETRVYDCASQSARVLPYTSPAWHVSYARDLVTYGSAAQSYPCTPGW